jgi:L-lactate dehydrogenase
VIGTGDARAAAGTAKIAIVGAGHVGVTLAYACMIRGTGKTIALCDRNAEKVRAEVLGLQHGLQFVPMATITGSDDAKVCRDADVLVMTVGAFRRRVRPGWIWPQKVWRSAGTCCRPCLTSRRTRWC